jgi:hypothetical protein
VYVFAIAVLPSSVQPVIKSVAFEGDSRGPSVQSVVDVLQSHGITVDAQKMEVCRVEPPLPSALLRQNS